MYVQLWLTLWPHGLLLLSSSVWRSFQALILEWAAISFSMGSSQTRNRTWVSCITGRFFTNWATNSLYFNLSSIQFSSVQSLSRVWLFVIPWAGACQAPPCMGFSRQEYWSGLPSPSLIIPCRLTNSSLFCKATSSVSNPLPDTQTKRHVLWGWVTFRSTSSISRLLGENE